MFGNFQDVLASLTKVQNEMYEVYRPAILAALRRQCTRKPIWKHVFATKDYQRTIHKTYITSTVYTNIRDLVLCASVELSNPDKRSWKPATTIHNKSNKQHSIHLFYHKIYTTAVAFTLRRRRIVSIITTAHAYKYIPCIHILHYHIQRPPYLPSQLACLMILLSKYETLRW